MYPFCLEFIFILGPSVDVYTVVIPKGKTECPFLQTFGSWPCSLWDMMKFSIIKRYNGKAGRVLDYHQLKIPYLGEEKRVFKLCFPMFLIV